MFSLCILLKLFRNLKRKWRRKVKRDYMKCSKRESIFAKLSSLKPDRDVSLTSSDDDMRSENDDASDPENDNDNDRHEIENNKSRNKPIDFKFGNRILEENDRVDSSSESVIDYRLEEEEKEEEFSDDSESDNENANLVFNFQNDVEKEQYIIESLRLWALEDGVMSMTKLDRLLARLRPVFPNLPVSYKTLLDTPQNIEVVALNSGGEMWYKSIRENLNRMELEIYLQLKGKIVMDVNIDGLPISKSSKIKFWPILGHLAGTKSEPFIIAIYLGTQNPQNVDEFLGQFVNEVHDLQIHGYSFKNNNYSFKVANYILDAPAFVKCCINHGGYCACDKCIVNGEWHDDRMTYCNLDEPLRTEESFLMQEQQRHHNGHSPLERLGTKMVGQFRLDVMHLVYEGVFKRLVTTWKEWNGAWKLDRRAINSICDLLEFIKDSTPSDFNRKPRSLRDLKFYKATEFRRLLLYDGILVFRDFTDVNVYKHFLLLHCGMVILSNQILLNSMHVFAGQALRTFIEHSIEIYGKKFVVYNVHILHHLEEECIQHGVVENFSAFKYENRLKSLKSSLKSVYRPLH